MINRKRILNSGFTLVELLIVIAVLGTLAVVVLIALDPVQQLARARDAGRGSTVAQLGHAMEARGTILNGVYPTTCTGGAWINTCLVLTGEINTVPSTGGSYPAGGQGTCGGGQGAQSGFCVNASASSFVIYAGAEAKSNTSQCVAGVGGTQAYFVYSATHGRAGLWCGAGAPNVTASNGQFRQ